MSVTMNLEAFESCEPVCTLVLHTIYTRYSKHQISDPEYQDVVPLEAKLAHACRLMPIKCCRLHCCGCTQYPSVLANLGDDS